MEDKIIDNEKLLKEAMSAARRLKMPISFIKSNVENSLLKKLLNNIRDNNINIIIKDIKTRSDVEVLKEAKKKI